MNKFLKFILVGYIFAMVVEFQFNILATGNIGNFIFTGIFYPVYLTLVYFSSKLIDRIFKSKYKASIVYYLIFGFIGLMLEWFMIGNSPWQNPDANQAGMFAFWVALTFMPRIFTDEEHDVAGLKRGIKKIYAAYAIITTIVGLILPPAFRIFWLATFVTIAYLLMNIFYLQYFKILKLAEGKKNGH